MKRLIAKDLNVVKNLKSFLRKTKNTVETKRVNIMIVYMGDKSIAETGKILSVSEGTVNRTIRRYQKNKKTFYETKYSGRKMSKEREVIKNEVEGLILESKKNQENIDILDVRTIVNRKHKKEVLTYHQAREMTRKILDSNYQKPYVTNHKQPENAKKILGERLTEAMKKVGIQENIIDEKSIKNKKTKNGRN